LLCFYFATSNFLATLLRKPHFVCSAGGEGRVETSSCKGVFYAVETAGFCWADHDTTTTLDTLRFVHALWRDGVYGTRWAEAGTRSASGTFFRCGRPDWYSAWDFIGSVAEECYLAKSLCDQSGGIELSVDSRHTAIVFPIGARIVVHCTSLALGDFGGSLVLGAQPTAEYVVDRIAEEDFDRYFLVDRSSAQSIEPERISISDIEPRHIGNFVLLEDVNFGDQAGLAWCETDPESGEPITTERILYDNDGNSIILRIEGGCSYAKEKIPDRSGAIGAIVESFNGVYQIRIINRNIYF